MIIAISQRKMSMEKGANRDALENDYVRYYESFGITLLPIPNVSGNIGKYFEKMPIEGIILTGGNDINPKLYGRKLIAGDCSDDMDNTYKRLIETALERKLPLFGSCRGGQFINVFFGGKLIKSIKEEITPDHAPGKEHKTTIKEARLIPLLGKKEFTVNSFHNQAVTAKTLSPQLKVFALAKEHGTIEGLYHPSLPIAGVQWHPERDCVDKEINDKLVKAFVQRELFWKR